MRNKVVLLFVLFLSLKQFVSQQDFINYYMPSIPQVMYQNPAFIPTSNVNIGLPVISSIYTSVNNSGFKYNDVIRRRDDDSLYIDMNRLLKKVAKRNFFVNHDEVDLLSFSFRVKKNYFSFNATENIDFAFEYPEDLLIFAAEGNGKSFLGNRISLDGLGIDATHYREYGIGYAREINEKLTVGGKLKYLNGMENIWTRTSQLGITTDSITYDLALDGSLELRTSGIERLTNDSSSFEFDPLNYALGQKNHGLGIDLGATYQLNEKIALNASLIDLGFINWKENTKTYKKSDIDYTFEGVDLYDFLDTAINAMDELQDTLLSLTEIEESNGTYKKMISARFHIGATYKFSDMHTIGGIIHSSFLRGRMRPGIALSYNYRLKRWLSASVNYSIYNRSFSNIGIGLSLNLGPVQFYVLTDNVLAPLLPHKTKSAHVRTGLNLTFARDKDSDGDKIADRLDKCPDVVGLKEFEGCPDTDGDGIQDSEDQCPAEFGLLEYGGCPDTDSDGIMDKEDECPTITGNIAMKGCPDSDNDGIKDSEDRCPYTFGVAEMKGCPDTDLDGIMDREDDCPNEAGPVENYGCPNIVRLHLVDEYGNIVATVEKTDEGFVFRKLPADKNYMFLLEGDDDAVLEELPIFLEHNGEKTRIMAKLNEQTGFFEYRFLKDEKDELAILEEAEDAVFLEREEAEVLKTAFDNLEFESGKAIIEEESFEALEQLAILLNKKPDWKIKLEGHTDDIGKASKNLMISKRRAEAVAFYLKQRGIDEARIIVKFYGESRPIADNETDEGRQQNRRVEMSIIE